MNERELRILNNYAKEAPTYTHMLLLIIFE